MRSNNASVVDLIHDITQAGFDIKFANDFEGMVRIDFTEQWNNDFYQHEHIGSPGCNRLFLENCIRDSLEKFLKNIKEPKP